MTILAAAASATVVGALFSYVLKGGRRRATRRGPSWSERSGLDVTLGQFWLSSIGAGLLAFALVFLFTGLVVVAIVPGLIIASLPRAYFLRKRARRVAAVQEAWPDGLRDLVSSVRSGASLPSALESLGSHGPEALREAFGGFSIYSRSLGIESALEMVRADLADPTSDRVIEVLILAHRRGGSVVPEILGDLAEATTRDVWTMEQVRSEALEQKINSRAVFVLPWLVLVLMTARSGAFRAFYSSAAGLVVVVLCGILSLLGMFIAARVGSEPDEPRVFTGESVH
jgi:tight adherence protein B